MSISALHWIRVKHQPSVCKQIVRNPDSQLESHAWACADAELGKSNTCSFPSTVAGLVLAPTKKVCPVLPQERASNKNTAATAFTCSMLLYSQHLLYVSSLSRQHF